MNAEERDAILDTEGPAAPPRQNGELLFAAPWESRIFGLTLALFDQGRFEWAEFQARLITAIARHEASLQQADDFHYYGCWLTAFGELASDKGWLEAAALADLEAQLAARPPGHDHAHG